MKKLYIFDFDGTLVNTFYDSVISYNNALKRHDKDVYQYERLEDIDYNDFINNMTYDEDILRTYQEEYENSKKEHTKAYPGIINTLKNLSSQGITLAICSNRIQEQLDEYVENIFSEVDFKYVIGYQPDCKAKPDPEMINKIINNETFLENEIVYVGDRKPDIDTARNVNIDVIIVKWGQGDKEVYADSYPIKFIDKAEQLLEL